ncbi:MAG: glycosyltransferase family 2 protein [Gluconobacter cerinus]|uniref:glycosyltransferase family 2 protein n=1 Tax=Gluconobacter cerinus TaxID=38307 RepID=UPI0039EC22B0
MKVAVVAIVRDEVSDILWWLGWYVSLGVDTIIVFDDGSKDGTDRIVADAACVHDIRLYRIESTGGSHTERHRKIHAEALEHLRDEFGWVGFLNVGEYALLPTHNTLHQFLDEMGGDVGAIGVNWRDYGYSGHVTKPHVAAFHTGPHHKAESSINGPAKSFVRPRCWSGQWSNVDYFDVAPYRYVNAVTQDTVSSDTPDITKNRVQSDNNVRPDSHGIAEANRGDLYGSSTRDKTNAMQDWVRRVIQQGYARVLDALPSSDQLTPLPPSVPTLHVFSVWSHEGNCICVRDTKLEIADKSPIVRPLLAIRIGEATSRVFLTTIGTDGNPASINPDGNPHLLDFLSYDTVSTTEHRSVALRQTGNNFFLSVTSGSLDESVPSDSQTFKDAEIFQLRPFENTAVSDDILNGPTLSFACVALSQPVSLATISALARKDLRLTVSVLPLLMDFLEDAEREMLEAKLPA